jgi:hypothetical protein
VRLKAKAIVATYSSTRPSSWQWTCGHGDQHGPDVRQLDTLAAMGELRIRVSDLPRLVDHRPRLEALAGNQANRGKPLESCEHDWRVDTTILYESEPAVYMVLCALCGAVSSVHAAAWDGLGTTSIDLE